MRNTHRSQMLAIATMLSMVQFRVCMLAMPPAPPSPTLLLLMHQTMQGRQSILSWALSPNDIFGTLVADSDTQATDPDLDCFGVLHRDEEQKPLQLVNGSISVKKIKVGDKFLNQQQVKFHSLIEKYSGVGHTRIELLLLTTKATHQLGQMFRI